VNEGIPVPNSTEDQPLDQIRPEHHRLRLVFDDTSAHLATGEGSTACRELREALEAHFEQEESLYYPTLWRLHPEYEDQLRALIMAHRGFLANLDRIIGLLDSDDSVQARADFERLHDQFVGHEKAEEALLLSMS
jgi:hypothetical protein